MLGDVGSFSRLGIPSLRKDRNSWSQTDCLRQLVIDSWPFPIPLYFVPQEKRLLRQNDSYICWYVTYHVTNHIHCKCVFIGEHLCIYQVRCILFCSCQVSCQYVERAPTWSVCVCQPIMATRDRDSDASLLSTQNMLHMWQFNSQINLRNVLLGVLIVESKYSLMRPICGAGFGMLIAESQIYQSTVHAEH